MKSKLKHNFIEFLDQIPLWWLEILVTIYFSCPILSWETDVSLRSTTSWMKAS